MATTIEALQQITEGPQFVIVGPNGYFQREGAGGTPRWTQSVVNAFKGTFQDCQTEVQIRGLRGVEIQAVSENKVGEAEVPSWQVSLDAGRQVAGFKLSIEGFASGADKDAAREALIREIDFMLEQSANWTPWNAAAKAQEDRRRPRTYPLTRGDGRKVRVTVPEK